MRGYPDLVGTRHGHVVVRARHTPAGYFGGPSRSRAVSLRTGESASAMYEGHGWPDATGPCHRYARLLVTPPGTRRALQLPRNNPDYALCYLEIHPVVPGRTGREADVPSGG
jgi:hypothetical protein